MMVYAVVEKSIEMGFAGMYDDNMVDLNVWFVAVWKKVSQ